MVNFLSAPLFLELTQFVKRYPVQLRNPWPKILSCSSQNLSACTTCDTNRYGEIIMANYIDKVALVTGGASGIGRATAIAFAQEGAKVLVSDIAETGGQETVRMIRNASGEATFVQADVTQWKEVAALIGATIDTYQQLDFALNSAGVQGVRTRTADYPKDEWQHVIDVNLNSVWCCMKFELDQMMKQGYGVIINLASVAGLVGFPSHSAYSASKHAVVGLTKSAALEYIRKGIRINAVCPGFTDTPMIQNAKKEEPEYVQRLIERVPARRMGTPEEIAAAILYLCSDQAGFVTGHTLVLDGGITAG
jgi:NAD(P)-dependent dehydrogenase (short-subunit alcohol dehydrogenase family)